MCDFSWLWGYRAGLFPPRYFSPATWYPCKTQELILVPALQEFGQERGKRCDLGAAGWRQDKGAAHGIHIAQGGIT